MYSPMHSACSAAPLMDPSGHLSRTDDEIDLRGCLEVLIRRKWLICGVLFAVFITVCIVTLAMTPIYKATGKLEFTMPPPRVTKFEEMVVPQTQTREFMNTQTKLLGSDSLAWRVIEALDLARDPRFQHGIRGRRKGG